jgi:hypothetical protein
LLCKSRTRRTGQPDNGKVPPSIFDPRSLCASESTPLALIDRFKRTAAAADPACPVSKESCQSVGYWTNRCKIQKTTHRVDQNTSDTRRTLGTHRNTSWSRLASIDGMLPSSWLEIKLLPNLESEHTRSRAAHICTMRTRTGGGSDYPMSMEFAH